MIHDHHFAQSRRRHRNVDFLQEPEDEQEEHVDEEEEHVGEEQEQEEEMEHDIAQEEEEEDGDYSSSSDDDDDKVGLHPPDPNATDAERILALQRENAKLRRRVNVLKRQRHNRDYRIADQVVQIVNWRRQFLDEKLRAETIGQEHERAVSHLRAFKRTVKRERMQRIAAESRSGGSSLAGSQPRRHGGTTTTTTTMPQLHSQPGRMMVVDSRKNAGPSFIVIQDCGTPAVNGTYYQDGYFEDACQYIRRGTWHDHPAKFGIFQNAMAFLFFRFIY